MINNVIPLSLTEEPCVNVDTIKTLQDALGLESGRDVVERAVFEISDRLCKLELALHSGDMTAVSKIAASLVCMSSQIGLLVFADVAMGLSIAVKSQNAVVAGALAARLLRLGESSLFCAVELADCSG